MKYTKYFLFLFIALFVSACSDDKNEPDVKGKEDDERTDIQKWIEDTMRKEYYWYNDIPEASKLKYKDVKPGDFFTSLLSKKDGKDIQIDEKTTRHYYYSYIEDLSNKTRGSIQTDNSYGFEFTVVNYGDEVRALVLYVLPNTPASTKLVRGNWISKIDDAPLTSSNYMSLYGSGECTFTVVDYDTNTKGFINPREVKIESARAVEDNPVFHYDIITSPIKGKTIGYLIYNHFTDGKGENDKSYDNELREVSARLKGVDEFVLDLRYNNGGLLSSAQLLCAILAPEEALGKSFGYLKYNDKKTPQKYSINVTNALLQPGGKNLDLKNIYILVSSSSASSSEMVINSLRPFMGESNVILIGEQTEGKNVGSVTYTSDDKQWEMHPIVLQIYNSVDFTDYTNGFPPDYELNEAFKPRTDGYVDLVDVHPLGDPEERLLNAAISLIDGKSITTRSSDSSSDKAIFKKTTTHSIDRRATNGVIVDID